MTINLTKGTTMPRLGFFAGKHSFDAIINQTDKVITPINPFDKHARALVKTPGVKPLVFRAHEIAQSQVREMAPMSFVFLWNVTVEYKYFGLRTIVIVKPASKS